MKEKKNQSPDEKPGAQEGAAKNPLKGLPRNVGRALTGATQNVGRTVGQNLRRRRRGKEAQPQIIENETETDTVPDNDTDENGLLLDHEDEEDPSSVKEENRTLPAESSLLVFGRWADILLDDSSIFLLLALFLALLLTVTQFERVQQNQIPLSVASSWVFLAYAAGQAVSIRQRPAPSQEEPTVGVAVEVVAATARSPELPASASTATATPIDSLRTRQTSHRLLNALLGPTRSSRILFKRSPSVFKVSSAWTHLNLPLDSARKTSWHRKCDPTRDSSNNDLMKILLRNRKFPRVRRSSGLKEASSPTAKESFSGVLEEEPSTAAPAAVQSSEMGSFELPDADSLDDFVVNPLLKLRGMDIFLTDGDPESSVADHPWLIENGLRDVPTFITNIISQWGNILIYFEMPAWVTDWKTIQEEKEDTDEVKALKRFLNGTDEYRNERLKMIPSLVEGPLACRVLAPPKKEKTIQCAFLSVSWSKHPPATVKGRKLCAAIKCELDCLSSRTIRGMAGIVKKHLHLLTVDVAVTISKPDGQAEEEPQACLGLWRFDHIDVASCPKLPDRFEFEAKKGQPPDVLKATHIMQLTNAEFQSLEQAV